MADTIQIVRWALAKTCALRLGDAFDDSAEAIKAINSAATYSKYISAGFRGFGIFGDVCVTSCTFAEVPKRLKGQGIYYPLGGFLATEEFESLGGVEGLNAMCAGCPANTARSRPAGCAGTIYQYPKSTQTQEQLENIIGRFGLQADYEQVFHVARPLWYGLWIRSPLSKRAVTLLKVIFNAMLEEDKNEAQVKGESSRMKGHVQDLSQFVGALEIAEETELSLHVSMAPPGHTDFGWYTIFPHCPICKAEARVERWKQKYPTQLATCWACGTQYPPTETASSERMEYNPRELREPLEGERFEKFAKMYLMAQGLVEADAAEVVELTEARQEKRQRDLVEAKHKDELRRTFITSVLYSGLTPVKARIEEDEENADQDWFSAHDFKEILRRCEDKGIKVTLMMHRSEAEKLGRFEFTTLGKPMELFAKWQEEGCNELFGASFGVPDCLLIPPA